jgi:hypothetical protein
MPDTGAPWNLPYPSGTGLVRDAPQNFEDLAVATAAGLDDARNEGLGPNVVQILKTDVFSTTSTTYVDVTGLEVTITPSAVDSKVFILADIKFSFSDTLNANVYFRITGGADTEDYVGDADGSRVQAATGMGRVADFHRLLNNATLSFVDSPATVSPVTYKIQALVSTGTGFVNRTGADGNSTQFGRFASSMTAIEVKA